MIGVILLTSVVLGAAANEFAGWQAMRVIHQEGYARRAIIADFDADGRDEIIIANARHSRLEIFRWLQPDQRKPVTQISGDNANALPMATDFDKVDVTMDQLPLDVAARDLDGDGDLELIAMVAAPNRLLAFERGEDGQWSQRSRWNLLEGAISSVGKALLIHEASAVALISFNEGIQTVALDPDARADWLRPRERHPRAAWWLSDFDRDGRIDLIEWTRQANQSIRWYRRAADGFLPAEVLHDRAINHAAMLDVEGGPAELLLLVQLEMGLVRRFHAAWDEPNDLGDRRSFPLGGGDRATWCGIQLGERRALVWSDQTQPKLNVYLFGNGQPTMDFPSVDSVKALIAPPAKPGSLLLWAKDAADLYVSRWDGTRLTFPLPMRPEKEEDDRRIIALDRAGSVTWWAQRVGAHVDLYVWPAGQKQAQRTRFEKLGKKIDRAVWLGGRRLLVREEYKKQPKLVRYKDGKIVVTEPGHLKKATLDQFRLVAIDGNEPRLARITDGALQWLDSDLHPVDQVMLPEGRKLISYVPRGDGGAWALQAEGRHAHRLAPDDAGILRVAETIDLPGGTSLRRDPVLGMTLAGPDRVVWLSPGRPRKLKLLQTIESDIGRPGAVTSEDASIHRIHCTDLDGDGRDEVLLHDDQRHQIVALQHDSKGLQPLITWPVFEDKAYPYGYGEDRILAEPRLVESCDLDGDQHRDLMMLCQDRLLIYLGREIE